MLWINSHPLGYRVVDENGLILRTLPSRREADEWAKQADDEYREAQR